MKSKVKNDAECTCCKAPVDVMWIDRSDWSGMSCILAGGKKGPSYEDDIKQTVEKHGFWMGRTDIAIFMVGEKQYVIEPYADGEPRGSGVQFLTDQGMQKARELNKKLLDVCEDHPWMFWKVQGTQNKRPKRLTAG